MFIRKYNAGKKIRGFSIQGIVHSGKRIRDNVPQPYKLLHIFIFFLEKYISDRIIIILVPKFQSHFNKTSLFSDRISSQLYSCYPRPEILLITNTSFNNAKSFKPTYRMSLKENINSSSQQIFSYPF